MQQTYETSSQTVVAEITSSGTYRVGRLEPTDSASGWRITWRRFGGERHGEVEPRYYFCEEGRFVATGREVTRDDGTHYSAEYIPPNVPWELPLEVGQRWEWVGGIVENEGGDQHRIDSLGHSNFEVLPLESTQGLSSGGNASGSRSATFGNLGALQNHFQRIQAAYVKAIEEGRPINPDLIISEILQ